MVNESTLSQNAVQHDRSCVVNFWREYKNSAYWCAKQSKGIPRKTANLILLTLYPFTETYLFPCKKMLSDNLEHEIAKL